MITKLPRSANIRMLIHNKSHPGHLNEADSFKKNYWTESAAC